MLSRLGEISREDLFPPKHGCIFPRQQATIEWLQKLVTEGKYHERQVGIFSKEIGAGGTRQYFVNTYAGAARDYAPMQFFGPKDDVNGMPANMFHMYEVILETTHAGYTLTLNSCEKNPLK